MQNIILMSSADNNWGIGKDNKLLAYVKEDMKRFTSFTKGNIIVVGRKTIATFKNQEPLKNRINIILTTDTNYKKDTAIIAHNIEEVLESIKEYDMDIFIVGGASVYNQMLPYCNKAYITKFNKAFDADTFIKNLDNQDNWILENEGNWEVSESGIEYKFCDYKKIH